MNMADSHQSLLSEVGKKASIKQHGAQQFSSLNLSAKIHWNDSEVEAEKGHTTKANPVSHL